MFGPLSKWMTALLCGGAMIGASACGGIESDGSEATEIDSAVRTRTAPGGPYKRTDFISSEDIRAAGGAYRIPVDGFGYAYINEIRAPAGSNKECMVNIDSVSEQARNAFAAQTGPLEAEFLRMQLYAIPELDIWGCLGLGVGCYILISP